MNKDEFSNFLNCEYYEKNALVQKFTAKILAQHQMQEINYRNVLEIGFGTGFLTNELLQKNLLNFDAIEISEKMFNYVKKNTVNKKLNLFLKEKNWILNQELNQKYDLIISNFTFQWLEKLDENLKILCKYSKKIIFSIPLQESFLNINCNLIENLISEMEVKKISKNYKIITFSEYYSNEISFIKHLKLIGATKKINKSENFIRFNKQEIEINYKIAIITLDN